MASSTPGGQSGRRSLLDQLLVAPLGRAVAGRDPHDVALLVADDLHLDVARPREVTLDVDLVASEEVLRLALGAGHRVVDVGRRLHHLHASAAAAERSLDGDRPAVAPHRRRGSRRPMLRTRSCPARSGRRRASPPCGSRPCRPSPRSPTRRPDERHAEVGDRPGEVGVLAEEAVARVHAVGAAAPDGVEDGRGVEVALRCGLTAERDRPRRPAAHAALRDRARSTRRRSRCPARGQPGSPAPRSRRGWRSGSSPARLTM